MLRAAHFPACCATEPSCGRLAPVESVMLAASPRTYTPSTFGAVRSGRTSMRPPPALRQASAGDDPACLQAAGPHHDPAGDEGPVFESHAVGPDFGDADSQMQLDADLGQPLPGVVL